VRMLTSTPKIGAPVMCHSCGRVFVYRGKCVRSIHAHELHFCTRRCMFNCFACGGTLVDGRVVLLVWGQTPAELLAELYRRNPKLVGLD
jgi:hypothetical protein